MTRLLAPAALAMTLCLAVTVVHGQPRGKGGEKPRGGRPPGGNQAERKPEGRPNQGARGANPQGSKSPGGEWSQRTHAGKPSQAQPGAGGAAAGHAAAKNNSPHSGAKGAAAGAAATNRNAPPVSGAKGAAAGAAATNRNAPKASGAQGAAAGAAVADRNEPKATGAQGAAAGAAAANRNEPAVSGAGGAAAGYAAVRNSFDHPNMYGHQWYGDHPGVWAPSAWAAGAAWVPSTWGAIAGYCGYGGTPTSYNYGVNVNAQDGNVIVDGQNVGTTEEFSQQAADLAQAGTDAETSDTEQWLPVGVFAMVRNEQQHPQLIVQMAVNKQGILRGNYTDEVTDHTLPIHGAVDKETQRAAWTVGGNKQTVMEAGLSDLAEGEAPALIHKNGKTDHWILVRLDPPKQDSNDAGK